jgi:hypothetical protein
VIGREPPHKAAAVEAETQGPPRFKEERAAEMPTAPAPLPHSEAAAVEQMRTVQGQLPRSAAR